MRTMEIKISEPMTEEQALVIAMGDTHMAWVIMEDHNSNARLQSTEKVWSYEYDYTKEDLEEMDLIKTFIKSISGTQAYYRTPYYFSQEEIEWDDIPF